MSRNNGKQVIGIQVEQQDALILDIIACRQRKSRSELLAPILDELVAQYQEQLEDEGIIIKRAQLQSELQSEMESWAEELEKKGQMSDTWQPDDLNIRSLVNASKRQVGQIK